MDSISSFLKNRYDRNTNVKIYATNVDVVFFDTNSVFEDNFADLFGKYEVKKYVDYDKNKVDVWGKTNEMTQKIIRYYTQRDVIEKITESYKYERFG